MTTPTELETKVRDWIVSIKGDDYVIFEHENGPVPPDPYVAINLQILDPVNFDVVRRYCDESDQYKEEVRGQCGVVLRIASIGGSDSLTLANRLRNSLFSSSRWKDLWPIMGRGDIGQINDLSSEYRSKIQPRHEFTLSGQTALKDVFDADYFDKIAVTTNVNGLEETVEVGTDCPPPSHITPEDC